MVKKALIVGGGTVGSRAGDALRSVGWNVSFTKRDMPTLCGSVSLNNKAQELLDIVNSHEEGVDVIATTSSNPEKSRWLLRRAGFPCTQSLDAIDLEDYDLIIDATPKGIEAQNIRNLYSHYPGVPFVINGGADNSLVENNLFAGIPGTTADFEIGRFKKGNAKIVSCNTHAVTALLANIQAAFGPNVSLIRDVNIIYLRRFKDPHETDERPNELDFEFKDYHIEEIGMLLPEFNGLMRSTKISVPVEYFHTLQVDISFHSEDLSDLSGLERKLRNYPRCIYLEQGSKLSHDAVRSASEELGIYDGDIYLPIYTLRPNKYGFSVGVLTPQRSIVTLSHVDYAKIRTGEAGSLNEAILSTDVEVLLRGLPVATYKHALTDMLSARPPAHEKPLHFPGIWTC